ncbi:MAG: hypothetical protein J5641_03700, partial [Bacteroidales bacterium]|nr:hypothetical protein [Bacteroidales bacterium]
PEIVWLNSSQWFFNYRFLPHLTDSYRFLRILTAFYRLTPSLPILDGIWMGYEWDMDGIIDEQGYR